MARRDVSGLVVQLTAEKVRRVRKVLRDKLDVGPRNVKMTKQEARRFFQAMSPEAKQEYIGRVGPDGWARMMDELYAGSAGA